MRRTKVRFLGADRTVPGVSYVVWALAGGLVLCAAATISMSGAARAQGEDFDEEFDEIVPKVGAPVMNVKIVHDNWRQVVGQKGPKAQIPISSFNIMEVVYSDAPRGFLKGVRRVARGYYTRAIEESFEPMLKKLDAFRKVDGHPWPKQYCLYYLGVSHLKRGDRKKNDPQKAREYFQKLVKEIPNTRFVFETYVGIGDSYQVEGNYAKAADAFKDAQKRFERLASDAKLKIEQVKAVRKLALMAYLRQAEMFDMGKLYDRAVTAYKRITNLAREYEDIRFMAMVGEVKAYVSLRSYDTAIRKAQLMIAKGEREGNVEYLGGAYMALADCYFERARREAKPEHLVVARYNYLRVATLYFMEERELPKARFRAGRCYERLGKLKTRGEGPRATELARRQYELVVERYPESDWAKEAKSRLAAIGD